MTPPTRPPASHLQRFDTRPVSRVLPLSSEIPVNVGEGTTLLTRLMDKAALSYIQQLREPQETVATNQAEKRWDSKETKKKQDQNQKQNSQSSNWSESVKTTQ